MLLHPVRARLAAACGRAFQSLCEEACWLLSTAFVVPVLFVLVRRSLVAAGWGARVTLLGYVVALLMIAPCQGRLSLMRCPGEWSLLARWSYRLSPRVWLGRRNDLETAAWDEYCAGMFPADPTRPSPTAALYFIVRLGTMVTESARAHS